MKIEDIEGIGPVMGDRLRAAGIASADALLEQAGPRAGREALAAMTAIDASRILEWVNHVDLMRIKGVGAEYSDLLEEAGVDSCAELARRNPANLSAAIAALVEREAAIVRRPPTEAMVADWIAQAAALPKVVTH